MDNSSGSGQEQPLTTKAVRSGAWIYGRNIVTSLINLGVMAILARQLTPADFGLVALATVLLRFVVILSEGGIGEYIISDNQEGRERRVQAAFWMNLTLSSAIILVGLIALPWIVRFYAEPGLTPVLILLGIRYMISQIAIVPYSLVKKDLGFRKLVVIDSTIEIASSLLSVIMALTGWGVLSLVVPGVLLAPLRTVWFMYVTRWVPRLPLHVAEWGNVFQFSSKVIVGSLATTIGAEGDTLVVGKVLGNQNLGLYNMSWGLANMVPRNLSGPVTAVAMPAFSTVSQTQERLKAGFHRLLRITSAMSFPLIVGLFVVADLFILTIYGPQWIPSILPLRILLIYALRYSVGSPANSIFMAVRRPDIPMKFGLAFIPVYIISILIGSFFGIVGVAIGVTLVKTLFGLLQLGVGSRLAGSKPSAVFHQISPALLASLGMGILVALARGALAPLQLRDLLELMILIGVGGLVYLILLIFVFKSLLKDLLSILDSLSPRLGASTRRVLFFRSSI